MVLVMKQSIFWIARFDAYIADSDAELFEDTPSSGSVIEESGGEHKSDNDNRKVSNIDCPLC